METRPGSGAARSADGAGVFVGRRDAVAALESTIDAAAHGRGVVALVAGEPGIGKSRLIAEVAARCQLPVLWAACWEGDGAPAFWPWRQVLRAMRSQRGDADSGAAADTWPELAGGDGRWAVDPGGDARFAMFDAVASALDEARRDGAMVVVIDDLQWADAASIRLLQFLGRDPRARRLAIIAMYRDGAGDGDGPLAEAIGELAVDGLHLHLAGLDEEEVAALVAATTDLEGLPSAASLQRRSGGNPFFLLELLRLFEASTGGASHRPAVVPASVRSVVATRLTGLSSRTRTVLDAASVVGPEFDVGVLASVVAGSRADVLEAVDEAIAARLVTGQAGASRFAFVHALVQEALYAGLGLADRATLHAAVADELERRGDAPVEEVAHHAVRAAFVRGDERAVEWATRAAEHSSAVLAHEQAAGWYGRALELLPPQHGDREGELLLRRGASLAAAGDVPRARDAFRQAAVVARERSDVDMLARAALGVGADPGGFEVVLRDSVQIALLEEALARLGPEPSALRGAVLARLSVALSLTGDEARRRALSEAAITTARQLDDPSVLAYALAAHCDVIAGPDGSERRRKEATEVVELARRIGDPQLELLGRRLRLVAALELGDVASADQDIVQFERITDTLRQPLYRWYVPLWQAMRALMRRDLTEAARLNAEAERIGRTAHSTNAAELTFTQRWVHERIGGHFAEVANEMEAFLGLGPGDTPVITGDSLVRLRVVIAAQAGDLEAASTLIHDWLAAGLHERTRDAEWLPETAQLAEVAALVGARDVATVLFEQLAPYAHLCCVEGIGAAFTGSVNWYLAMLARSMGRDTDAERFDDAAAAVHRHVGLVGDPPPLAVPFGRRPTPTSVGRAALVHEGATWAVTFAGTTRRLRDSKGLRDLAVLLSRPDQDVHCLELAGGADVGAEPGPALDRQARRAYEQRIRDLHQEIEEARQDNDPYRAERAETELDALVHELTSAFGLAGRSRAAGAAHERARSTVTARIRAAIKVAGQAHPELGRHLQNAVHTGTWCAYRPESRVTWDIRSEPG